MVESILKRSAIEDHEDYIYSSLFVHTSCLSSHSNTQ
jgi:hypothetical protein